MTFMLETYPSILRDGELSYGGNQLCADSAAIRRCGCGPVAALDLALYLSRSRGAANFCTQEVGDAAIPLASYNALLQRLCRKYFPIVPPFGTTGVALAIGLNRLLKDLGLSYKAKWVFSGEKTWVRMTEMLANDIPVILGIGMNFPRVWGDQQLSLYIKSAAGEYRKTGATKAHFLTVTGMDGDWLRVSSWGRMYYISRTEFDRYARKNSLSAICNIVYIRKIGRG